VAVARIRNLPNSSRCTRSELVEGVVLDRSDSKPMPSGGSGLSWPVRRSLLLFGLPVVCLAACGIVIWLAVRISESPGSASSQTTETILSVLAFTFAVLSLGGPIAALVLRLKSSANRPLSSDPVLDHSPRAAPTVPAPVPTILPVLLRPRLSVWFRKYGALMFAALFAFLVASLRVQGNGSIAQFYWAFVLVVIGVAVAFNCLYFRNAGFFVDELRVGIIDLFRRRRFVSRSSLTSIAVRIVVTSGVRTFPRVLLIGSNAQCLFRMTAAGYEYEDLVRFAAILQVPIDPPPGLKVTLRSLAAEYPKAVSWPEEHPRVLFSVFLVAAVAIAVLTALSTR